MVNDVVIKVNDTANGFDFEIPVSSESGSALSISKSLSDLTDLTKRSGVQSIGFKIVITKGISTAYDYFHEAQHLNYKDVDADKDAVIIVNGNQFERGKIRILGYENKDGIETVKLLFIGNNYDWTEAGKNLTMADIVWSTISFNYLPQNIKGSWPNTVAVGDEHVFPLENRGGRKEWSKVHTEDFRPAFFLTKIIERFLQNIGYTVSSTFLNSASFRKLVISHFGTRFRIPQTFIDDNFVKTGDLTGTNVVPIVKNNQTINGANNPIYYDKPLNVGIAQSFTWDDSTDPFNDAGGNYDPAGGTNHGTAAGVINSGRFTAPRTGYYKFEIEETSVFVAPPNFPLSGKYNRFHFITYLKKYDASGNPLPIQMGYGKPNNFIGSITGDRQGKTTQSSNTLNGEILLYLKVNESVEVWRFFHDFNVDSGTNNLTVNSLFNSWLWHTTQVSLSVTLDKRMSEADTFNFTEVLDDQIKVIDILNDISRCFNLFWDADPVLKQVTVEPRDDFYNSIATAVDFTNRLNLLRPIITNYNSSKHRSQMIFKYAIDSDDKFVQGRDQELATILAEYTHNLPAKFKEGVTKVQLSAIAASYWVEDTFAVGYNERLLAPYTTRYWNEYINTIPAEQIENNSPRLLNYEYKIQNGDGSANGGPNAKRFRFYDEPLDRTQIPYVLAHQVKIGGTVIASTDFNLFWHKVTDQDGLFTTYWSKTVTEIINGTQVSCFMLFNDKQWIDFKFQNLVYISEPVEMKGYWVVEKLSGYQPENSQMVRVKLLNRIEWDVQTEGAVVYEEKPIDGDDNPNNLGAVGASLLGGTGGNPMNSTVPDGNNNDMEVAMTVEDENGFTTPMTL